MILKTTERALFIVGILLLGFCAFAYIGGRAYSRMAVKRFSQSHEVKPVAATSVSRDLSSTTSVNYGLWSEKRIKAYQDSLQEDFDMPEAVLRIDRIKLEVPVFAGTDDLTLNRGAGRIAGTPRPGETGNSGIAGHRDGFFRGLKDVSVGDTIRLETETGEQTFAIDRIVIVDPSDVSVLKNEPRPALTLVTCYPFYFIGNAPQRYIVHASLVSEPKPTNEPVKASLKTAD
jgi:sortase A